MAYVTKKYYENTYKGKCEDKDLAGLISAAGALIDTLTHNRIKALGFESLTAFQKEAVKKACCLIVDHMAAGGGARDVDIDSYSLQDIRVHMRRRKLRPWEAAGCGLWAWTTLMQTGLMRGVLS